MPKLPISRAALFDQEEPAPETVTSPVDPVSRPTKPSTLLTAPPSTISNLPEPPKPTDIELFVVQLEPEP